MNRWDGIDEVVAVADSGSFAKAAELLGSSTSHVSRAVARIESRLAVQLFSRTTRHVSETAVGAPLIAQFRQLVISRDEAIAMLDQGPEPQGALRISCSVGLGVNYVAPLVIEFAKAYPKLSVQFDLSDRLVDIVAEGYDIAIRTGQLADSRLVRTRIASRRFITCAAPAYIEQHGKPSVIAGLADHALITGVGDIWHFREGNDLRQFRPQARWHFNNGNVVARAAVAGLGICQLPEFYVHDLVLRGELVALLPNFQAEAEPIWAVFPSRRHMLTKVQYLIERLRRELGRQFAQQSSDAPM